MKKYLFHVSGMHCAACSTLIESELCDLPEVLEAKASLTTHSLEIVGEFGEKGAEEVMRVLDVVLVPHGYSLTIEKQTHGVRWVEFHTALPIAGAGIAFFIFLQKLGLVNLVTASQVGYSTAFLIGLIASVSTCMAVVGGLVLSLSASVAKGGDPLTGFLVSKVRPQMLFHVSRIVSFFVLGGAIGALGSAFQPSAMAQSALGIVIALVLLVLGVNLLDIFPWMKRFQPTMPRAFGRGVHGLKRVNHMFTPLILGMATFFLPCGFTQSMQLYALTTGSFITGAGIMLAFALGTLPVLALLSFSALRLRSKEKSGIFFKSAGIVVIFFGLLNLASAAAALGLIAPFRMF